MNNERDRRNLTENEQKVLDGALRKSVKIVARCAKYGGIMGQKWGKTMLKRA
jgi:hypothetical protein